MPPALPGAACVLLTLPRVLPAKSDQFSFLLPFLGNESSGTRTELASSPGGGKCGTPFGAPCMGGPAPERVFSHKG